MRAPLPRTRTERWSAVVLDRDGIPTGDELALDADMPGTLDWRSGQPSPLGARLTAAGPIPDLAQGQSVQVTHHCDEATEPTSYPPLIPIGDSRTWDMGEWVDLQLVDQTIILAADGIDAPVEYHAATRALAALRVLHQATAPDVPLTLPDVDYTIREALEYAASTSQLDIYHDLAAAAGATPPQPKLGRDGLVSEAITMPSQRGIAMRFGPEQVEAGYLPEVQLDTDYLASPNVAHYHAGNLLGVWQDLDPFSRWSIPRRGRRILTRNSGGKGTASTQEIANLNAQALLLEVRRRSIDGQVIGGRGRVATITAGWQPLGIGEVIEVEHPDHEDVSGLWEVIDITVRLGLGSDMTLTLREVTL